MTADSRDELGQDETSRRELVAEFVEQEIPAPGLPDACEEYGLPAIERLVENDVPAPGQRDDPSDDYGSSVPGSDRSPSQSEGGDSVQVGRP